MLFGHAAAERVFDDARHGGRLHHAWLIAGPEGVGKATLAFRFARLLLSGGMRPNDPETPLFRRVAQGTHADLLTVQRAYDEKRKRLRSEIVVDDMREIGGFLHLTPAEGGWRVVVVDGAEHLNRNAANAVLKVLEEPPIRAILFLTCATPGRLLPTIRSRCRRLTLEALAPGEMAAAVGFILPGITPDEVNGLVSVSRGSPGRAALLSGDGMAVLPLVTEVLAVAPGLPTGRAYEIADRLVRTDTGFGTFMDLLREQLEAVVRNAARGRADAAGERLAAARPLAEWGEVWHALGRLQDETERSNLDKRHAIVSGLELLNTHG